MCDLALCQRGCQRVRLPLLVKGGAPEHAPEPAGHGLGERGVSLLLTAYTEVNKLTIRAMVQKTHLSSNVYDVEDLLVCVQGPCLHYALAHGPLIV